MFFFCLSTPDHTPNEGSWGELRSQIGKVGADHTWSTLHLALWGPLEGKCIPICTWNSQRQLRTLEDPLRQGGKTPPLPSEFSRTCPPAQPGACGSRRECPGFSPEGPRLPRGGARAPSGRATAQTVSCAKEEEGRKALRITHTQPSCRLLHHPGDYAGCCPLHPLRTP